MIYRILYNKQEIYGPNLNMAVLNPTLELELNAAGRLEFTLPVTRSETTDDDGNPIWPDSVWNNIQVFNGEIEVWDLNDAIPLFQGVFASFYTFFQDLHKNARMITCNQ